MIISSCSRRWAESEYYVSSSNLLLSECIALPTHSERLSRDDRPSRPHPRSDRPAPAARPEPSPPDAHQHISNQVMQGRRRVLTLLLPDTCRGRPRKRGSSPDPDSRPSGTPQWHSVHYHSFTDKQHAVFQKGFACFPSKPHLPVN